MRKERPCEEERYNGGRDWVKLLSEKDLEGLAKLENEVFGKQLCKGYAVAWAMGTESGRLLKDGPYVSDVQTRTAFDEITEMRRRDVYLLAEEIGRMNETGNFKSPWWGKDFQAKHLPQYAWTTGAIVPPQGWEKKTGLTIEDITFDPKGVTVFVKRDVSARRLGIFD